MGDTVKLNELTELLETLDYPIDRAAAIEAIGDAILQYADGEERLTAVLERSTVDTYRDLADLESEIRGNVPVEAVGEPGQSEGEG